MQVDYRIPTILHLLFPFLFLSSIVARQQQQHNGNCEKDKVPTMVKVWPDGRPELFCHFPLCPLFSSTFSSSTESDEKRTEEKQMAEETKKWQRDEIGREKSGRKGKDKREEDERGGERDEANGGGRGDRQTHCNGTLSAAVCDLPDQWTVALVEVNNGTHISLLMRCCAVARLSEWAAPLKQVVLAPGEQFSGGQVLHNGKIVAYDVIKEVRKNVTTENDVRFVLSVFRVLCASAPPLSADSSFSARPIFSHLSGVRLAPGDADAGVSVAAANASQRSAMALRERPSFALMRKAMQKAKEWRRRPSSLRNDSLLAPTNWTKTVVDLDGIRNAKQSQTDGKNIGDISHDSTTTTAAKMITKSGTMAEEEGHKTITPSLPPISLNGRRNGHEDGTSFDSASTLPTRTVPTPPTDQSQSNEASFTTEMALLKQYNRRTQTQSLAQKQRSKKGGDRIKYTGLTTIRHRIDGPMNWMSNERKAKEGDEEEKKGRGMGEEKPKTFGTAGAAYTLALKNVQLMDIGRTAESSSKSEEDELQSVKEQQQKTPIANEWAASQLTAAAAEAQKATVGESAASGSVASGDEKAPQLAANCATIRSGRSDGCDGTAPSELVLSCGLCSCSQCKCSGLPSSCNGPNCPFCPSMCQCPTECGCDSTASLPPFNGIQNSENGIELGESQAVEMQQQQYIPSWNEQQQIGASQNYYAAPNFGYDANGGGYGGGTALNAAFASLQCFSGDQLVRTARGPVRMDQLRIGDLVLSMDESLLSFSPVLMFLHRKPSESALFVRIFTEFGHQLQLTALHLIWVGCAGRLRLIRANELRPGQCVYALEGGENGKMGEEIVWGRDGDGTERVRQTERRGERRRQTKMALSRIVHIDKVRGHGIYAPLTANGNILVNGVLASCHANLAAQTLQQTFFNWWRALREFGHNFHSVAFASGLWQLAGGDWWTNQQNADRRHAEGEDLPMGVHFFVTVLDTLMPESIL
ncbi:hypothetical protein niasHS_007625 [Heterodera schachtii]|uniref:Hint domain-containing protein n=1 Tax=Heterodera schachtii TaxID=97005 RepID=A0ABD2JP70_HETSC